MKRQIMYPKAIIPILMLLFLSGYQASAQDLPGMAIRFNNPRYICEPENYCVDVEFLSEIANREIYGVNMRFFYDGSLLEYEASGNFQGNYILSGYNIDTGEPGSGPSYFELNDPLMYFNGYVVLTDPGNPLFVSTDPENWTYLYTICFKVIDPASKGITEFCPPLVLDLTEDIDPDTGERIGHLPGDDGVQVNLLTSDPVVTDPTIEDVVQFNWAYDGEYDFPNGGGPFNLNLPAGAPVPIICTDTNCGYVIPLSNWALVLAIGLMLVASVFIYRRRMS